MINKLYNKFKGSIFYKILFMVIIILVILSIFFLFFKTDLKEYSKIQNPENYKELYSLLKNLNRNNSFDKDYGLDGIEEDSSSNNNLIDYSDTNIQVLGVQEADIIKTDGNYIYALSNEYLYIIKADKGNLKLVSSIKHREIADNSSSMFVEIYLKNNKLIAIENKYKYDSNYSYPENDGMEIFPIYGSSDTAVVIFDITDIANPKKENELIQSGGYLSSRMIDNYLYLVTNYSVYESEIKSSKTETYIPYTETEEKKLLEVDDIYIVPNPSSSQYLVVTGMNVNSSDDFTSKKSVFGSGSTIYSSKENLYVASYESVEEAGYYKSKTNILKFSLKEGKVDLKNTGVVNGSILNQFSMDEYSDTFRIVTTNYDYKIYSNDFDNVVTNWNEDSKNNIYVLNEELKLIGKIENLAKGERVYSVRFDQEIAYFVTYEQVDPLFAVDLTNPKKPVIINELKIPGFSEYLHVYSEKYLFGLGKEASATGEVLGIKISMYDITDKTDIKEKYKLVLGSKYSWSEASYNHKAILVSPEKNIVAFPADSSYLVFSFDETDGFKKIGEIKYSNNYWFSGIRGLYINDYFYVFNTYDLRSYDISSFSNIKILELEDYPDYYYDKVQ